MEKNKEEKIPVCWEIFEKGKRIALSYSQKEVDAFLEWKGSPRTAFPLYRES